jgi:hypothetical protein
LQDLNDKAARAIEAYIASQNLGVQGVQVAFDGASGKVVVQGQAPRRKPRKKSPCAAATWPVSKTWTT